MLRLMRLNNSVWDYAANKAYRTDATAVNEIERKFRILLAKCLFSLSILDNISFEINQKLYIDLKQIIKTILCETINI